MRALTGLVVGGQVTIEIPQEVHPHAPTRSCVLLKASRECRQGSVATFLSLAVGEFDLEVYRLSPEGAVELLFADDFIFK